MDVRVLVLFQGSTKPGVSYRPEPPIEVGSEARGKIFHSVDGSPWARPAPRIPCVGPGPTAMPKRRLEWAKSRRRDHHARRHGSRSQGALSGDAARFDDEANVKQQAHNVIVTSGLD